MICLTVRIAVLVTSTQPQTFKIRTRYWVKRIPFFALSDEYLGLPTGTFRPSVKKDG